MHSKVKLTLAATCIHITEKLLSIVSPLIYNNKLLTYARQSFQTTSDQYNLYYPNNVTEKTNKFILNI